MKKTSKPRINKIEAKEKLFARAYVENGGNLTQAAKAAGCRSKSDVGLAKTGRELLERPGTKAEIKRITELATKVTVQVLSSRQQREVLSAREVLERLSEQATFDPTPYLRGDGSFDLLKIRQDGVGHLFEKLEVQSTVFGDTCHARPYSHQRALIALAKIYGLDSKQEDGEVEKLRLGVAAYVQTRGCSWAEAVAALSVKYALVAKHSQKLLEGAK